jgi:hypothetical protein
MQRPLKGAPKHCSKITSRKEASKMDPEVKVGIIGGYDPPTEEQDT